MLVCSKTYIFLLFLCRFMRNQFKHKAFILTMLLVFITTNIGLSFYTHSCKISDSEEILFALDTDPCEDLHQVKQIDACCNESSDQQEIQSTPCCSTNAQHVSLRIDLNIDQTKISVEHIQIATFQPFLNVQAVALPQTVFVKKAYLDYPPSKLQGRDLQSIHQVYTI